METERKILEESTKKQLVKERQEELIAYLYEVKDCHEAARYWKLRAAKLVMFTLAAQWCSLLAFIVTGVEPTYINEANHWLLIVFFAAVVREHIFDRTFAYIDGEFDGILKTLEKLGIASRLGGDGERRKRRAKSPFKRFKELFERVAGSDKQEAHA